MTLLVALVVSLAAGPMASAQNAPVAPRPSAQPPIITFRKVFKTSTPEFVEIKIDERGAGTYDIRQIDDQPAPQPFQATQAVTAKIFSLADQLHDFDGVQLDVRRRIADLGQKTFRYEKGTLSHEITFNYTVNPTANELLELFEGVSLELQYVDELRRSMRYDPLGLNDVLLRLQSDYDQKLLPDPQSLLPLLDKIGSNSRYLDIARQRAQSIANRIRAGH